MISFGYQMAVTQKPERIRNFFHFEKTQKLFYDGNENFFKMADGQQTKKNSKEAMVVNKAIPKVVTALEAIISRTNDKQFRERCLQKLLIKEKTDLACKLESKLWEIAEQRLGVKQILSQEDAREQVVPGEKTSSHTSQVKTNSQQNLLPRLMPSTEKDSFDDLALIDMTCPLSDANVESFYEDENENNIHDVPAPEPYFLLKMNSLSQDLVGEVPLMNCIEHSSLESKDSKTRSTATTDDWLNNFTADSFWMDNNQDCSSLESSQNLLKRQRSPLSLSQRKIVVTSEPNLYAYNFIHCKGQERNGTEVVIISDEEEVSVPTPPNEKLEILKLSNIAFALYQQEHRERKLETKSQYHRCISSPCKIDDSKITSYANANNSDGPLHQTALKNLPSTCTQNLVTGHRSNDFQVIEPCRIKDTIIIESEVPDLHGVNNKSPLTIQSPKLEIIADHSIIHDFDVLEDSFDD